jgi:hypothetical protein
MLCFFFLFKNLNTILMALHKAQWNKDKIHAIWQLITIWQSHVNNKQNLFAKKANFHLVFIGVLNFRDCIPTLM